MGRHADVIFLIRGSRNRIDAGRRRERLVFGNQRRRGDLRDHESGIQTAVVDQEGRQAAHFRVHEHGNAALRQAADFRDRQGKRVGGKGHGLGVKISARQHLARFGEQQRIIRHRIGFDLQRRAAVANQVQARAHHLGLAAEGIGILHARAIKMRGPNGAARDQFPILARHGNLAGLSANLLNARIEGRVAALQCINRHGAGDDGGGEQVLGAKQARQRQAPWRLACR